MAAERFLFGLVDDPHAAAAHLAQDAVIAQAVERLAGGGGRSAAAHPRGVVGTGPDLFHEEHAGKRSRMAAASAGSLAVYSTSAGRSPRRQRSRNSSASAATGSRSEPESVMGEPSVHTTHSRDRNILISISGTVQRKPHPGASGRASVSVSVLKDGGIFAHTAAIEGAAEEPLIFSSSLVLTVSDEDRIQLEANIDPSNHASRLSSFSCS
jgi:hypothetical protein